MDFNNQVALITGASRGIGRCLAVDLAARGAVVVGCGRSEEHLNSLLDEIRHASPRSLVIACDVRQRAQVRDMMHKVLDQFGAIDLLINNAGIGMRKTFVETSVDTVEEIMQTNYLGMVYCTSEVLPGMIARGKGQIVNLSSGAGKIGALNMAAYSASKFAMNGFSESLYHELKPLGIHVSVICPGPVRTEFNRSFARVPPKAPSRSIMSARAVSQAVIKAIEAERFEVVIPRWLAATCWVKRIAPNVFRAVYARVYRPRAAARGKSPAEK